MIDDLREEEIVNKVGGRFKLSTLIQKRLVALNAGDKAATVELPASLGTGWKQVFGEPEASGSATFPKVEVPMQAGRVWVRNSK